MPGAGLELLVRVRQQRRRARHEEPHVLRQFAGEARIVEQAGVEGRHAHHRGGLRHPFDQLVDVELRQEDHRTARKQHDVRGHEKPVGVEDRQRVQQHVILGEAPMFGQRLGVRQQIVLRQHGAFGAPRGARGVEEGRKILTVAVDGLEAVGLAGGGVAEAARAIRVERQKLRAESLGDRAQPGLALGPADHQRRAAVLDEIGQLVDGVAGVERQKDHPGLHAGGIERQRLGRLVDLRRQPVARRDAKIADDMREARRHGKEVRMAQHAAIGEHQEGGVLSGMGPEEAVIQRVRHGSGSYPKDFSALAACDRISGEAAIW